MATKKKRKAPAKSKRASPKKATAAKRVPKRTTSRRVTKKAGTSSPKKAAGAKRVPKRTASKRVTKKAGTSSGKTVKGKRTQSQKPVRKNIPPKTTGFDRSALESRSGTMSGDLQGIRNTERADSESVSDLLEEGNAFEAGIVTGVEDAEDNPEKEVQTREVPEDDVPEEYLDEE